MPTLALRVDIYVMLTFIGVLAVAYASKNTLRMLEYYPQLEDPTPNFTSSNPIHYCSKLLALQKLESFSLTIPTICEEIFQQQNWKGECRIRAKSICDGTQDAGLGKLLRSARAMIYTDRKDNPSSHLTLEIDNLTFEPKSFSFIVSKPGQSIHKAHGTDGDE
jgi:hypothetical protein